MTYGFHEYCKGIILYRHAITKDSKLILPAQVHAPLFVQAPEEPCVHHIIILESSNREERLTSGGLVFIPLVRNPESAAGSTFNVGMTQTAKYLLISNLATTRVLEKCHLSIMHGYG